MASLVGLVVFVLLGLGVFALCWSEPEGEQWRPDLAYPEPEDQDCNSSNGVEIKS